MNKKNHIRLISIVFLAASFSHVEGATRYVTGGRGAFETYAVIERNGIEYRTDRMGQRFNQMIWDELGSSDRKALVEAYGWQINRRRYDFGADGSNAISDWVNKEQGWTDLVEALKQRRAAKEFPALAAVFGEGQAPDIPGFYCSDPEIYEMTEFKEAARLARELNADFEVGQQVYNKLINADWEKVSVAVKALSEKQIGLIVDQFITGNISGYGLSKVGQVSDLLINLLDKSTEFQDGLRNQLLGWNQPEPSEIIPRLERFLDDMETTANTAANRVCDKQGRLRVLAETIQKACNDKIQAKTDKAKALKDELVTKTTKSPPPASLPDFVPADPEASEAEKNESIRTQAAEFVRITEGQMRGLIDAKNQDIQDLVTMYSPYLSAPGIEYLEWIKYFDESSENFGGSYAEIRDPIDDVQSLNSKIDYNKDTWISQESNIDSAPQESSDLIDTHLPEINKMHGKLLWADKYQNLLGFKPSESWLVPPAHDFNGVIDIVTKNDRTVPDLIAELTSAQTTADSVKAALPMGIGKRIGWMASKLAEFQPLRFNFENSLSYVIAAIKQLDRLHSGPYFKKSDLIPPTCYGSACFNRYTVDIEGIRNSITQKSTPETRVAARAEAVKKLHSLRDEEKALLDRLEKAQSSHLNDVQNLEAFYSSVWSRFDGYLTQNEIIEEFNKHSGTSGGLKSQSDMMTDLLPDITYYYLGDGIWIRNESNLSTNIMEAVYLVGGEIDEYHQLNEIYYNLRTNKSSFMAMNENDFNAFMTDLTKKIGAYPQGSWITAFEISKVWGPEWPAWQLVMKTRWLQEALNTEYRGYGIPDPVAWDINGKVVKDVPDALSSPTSTPAATSPIGIPGLTVQLDGYLHETTTTESDGSFHFTWIGSGDFTISTAGSGYDVTSSIQNIKISNSDIAPSLLVKETNESGYSLSGSVLGSDSYPISGMKLALFSANGTNKTITTGADGSYLFYGLPAGTYTLRLVDTDRLFLPGSRSINLPATQTNLNFVDSGPSGPQVDLSVEIIGAGMGQVKAIPAMIDCPGVCFDSIPQSTMVTLNAIPEPGSLFAGWHDACSGTGACIVSMSETRKVIADFVPDTAPDIESPVVTSFEVPSTVVGLDIPITLTATDNISVTGYLLTTKNEKPMPNDSNWVNEVPNLFNVDAPGSYRIFAWARDAAGNISEAAGATVIVVAKDEKPSRLINIATRGQVGTGDNVLIGGFVISGTQPKKVLIRAIGPSMTNVAGTLANPQIALHKVTGEFIDSNNDWASGTNATQIQAMGMAPTDSRESALLLTLDPNIAYTPIVSGVSNTSGVALVEVYDVDEPNVDSRLINIATRGQVGTGDNVLIGGFVISGTQPKKVLIRAIGPSMTTVAGTLANPQIALHKVTGEYLGSNDNWGDSPNVTEIVAMNMQPLNNSESAMLVTLPPGPYTPIVSGVNSSTGVGLVEVYEVP